MKISKREDFAIIFMSHLARQKSKEFLSLTKIAKSTGLSSFFLKHIALELKNKGLIESREGVAGGYRLKKSPEEISATEILLAVSKEMVKTACYDGDCRLTSTKCICHSFWGRFNLKLASILNQVSLAEIAKI